MEKSCTTFSFTSTSVRICLSIRCFPQSRLWPGGDRSMREQRHKAWGLSWASWVQTGDQRTQGPWSLAMTAPLLCQWGGKQREKESPLLYLKLMLKLLSLTPWSTPDGIGADMPVSRMRRKVRETPMAHSRWFSTITRGNLWHGLCSLLVSAILKFLLFPRQGLLSLACWYYLLLSPRLPSSVQHQPTGTPEVPHQIPTRGQIPCSPSTCPGPSC